MSGRFMPGMGMSGLGVTIPGPGSHAKHVEADNPGLNWLLSILTEASFFAASPRRVYKPQNIPARGV